jgi:hypothetical protein
MSTTLKSLKNWMTPLKYAHYCASLGWNKKNCGVFVYVSVLLTSTVAVVVTVALTVDIMT